MHDDDNRLIMKEEPQLAMWAVYTALTLLLVFAAIDYCCTVEDNGGGWYPSLNKVVRSHYAENRKMEECCHRVELVRCSLMQSPGLEI